MRLGDAQEERIEQYEPEPVSITVLSDDLRTLVHLRELGLDDSGIIDHILHCIGMHDL